MNMTQNATHVRINISWLTKNAHYKRNVAIKSLTIYLYSPEYVIWELSKTPPVFNAKYATTKHLLIWIMNECIHRYDIVRNDNFKDLKLLEKIRNLYDHAFREYFTVALLISGRDNCRNMEYILKIAEFYYHYEIIINKSIVKPLKISSDNIRRKKDELITVVNCVNSKIQFSFVVCDKTYGQFLNCCAYLMRNLYHISHMRMNISASDEKYTDIEFAKECDVDILPCTLIYDWGDWNKSIL